MWGDFTWESETDDDGPSGKSEVTALGARPPCLIFPKVIRIPSGATSTFLDLTDLHMFCPVGFHS